MPKPALHGLYAITDSSQNDLLQQVELALKGGATIIQYRDKSNAQEKRQAQAKTLLDLCHQYSAILIINDDIELAHKIGADGVHLGKDDPDIKSARRILGPEAIIGVSCYNQLTLARDAQKAGVDYVAFGRFFPSLTKPDAVQADISLLNQARHALSIPMVAIGGITPENGGPLVNAGADMLAVIKGLWGQKDIRTAAEQFRKLFA